MVDVALVELEGVVFATRELRSASLRDALAAHGIDVELDEDAIAGVPTRAAVAATLAAAGVAADEVLIDLLTVRADRAFTSRLAMGGVTIVDGARVFLEQSASVARIGAVTRANRSDVEVMLRLSGLETAFAVTVCGDDTLEMKPSPDGYHLALDRLQRLRPVAARATLALEDSMLGIRAARAAGARCVAVGVVPAHVAMEANALVPSLEGQSLAALDMLAGTGQERVQ